jgi:hypothetical protein
MAEVLAMLHEGTRCAIPASQALSATNLEVGVALVRLWGEARPGKADAHDPRLSSSRALSVHTALGPRWLGCSNVQILELPRTAVFRVPPLLGDVLGLPHVVALGELEGRLLWLVDLHKFHPDS